MSLPHRFPFRFVDVERAGRAVARVTFGAYWRRGETAASPALLVEGVATSAQLHALATMADDGSLLYLPGETAAEVSPVWVDRAGKAVPLPLPPRSYLHPRLSPDGRQLAIEVEGASHDIFTYDFARGALTKMSFDGASHWRIFRGGQVRPLQTRTGSRRGFFVG